MIHLAIPFATGIWLALGLFAWIDAALRCGLKPLGEDWGWWIMLPGFLGIGPFAFVAMRIGRGAS